jgi:hypothetical protein
LQYNSQKWKNSGFSVDNSVFIFAYNDKARESLCQYIARHPVALKKITYESTKKKILYHTKYNDYWGENIKLFNATDFIADLTLHIPPKGKHLIRYYGLYASRTKGKSKQNGRYEKFGIKKETDDKLIDTFKFDNENTSNEKSKKSWARLIQKVYEVAPLICPYCKSEMRIIAVIQDKSEIQKIITCLERKNKSPPVLENVL